MMVCDESQSWIVGTSFGGVKHQSNKDIVKI